MHGAQEKTLAEFNGEFALNAIPTNPLRCQQRMAAAVDFGSQSDHRVSASLNLAKAKPNTAQNDGSVRKVPVYGHQEHSAHNGHLKSTCYHPLLPFNDQGDRMAAKLRLGQRP